MALSPPSTDQSPATDTFVTCRHCGHPLVPVASSGLALIVSPGPQATQIRHRVTLICGHCDRPQTWTPSDERPRRT